MSKRAAWSVLACGLAASALLLSWLLLRDDRTAPRPAAAGEERAPAPQAPPTPQTFLEEQAPWHPTHPTVNAGGELRVGAGRHVFPGGAVRSYVSFDWTSAGGEMAFRISPESALDLVRRADTLKGRHKAEADVVAEAWVYWSCDDVATPGRKLILWYDLRKGVWGWGAAEMPADLIDAVRAALKDHEELARVKPSVQF